jgi:hypothetical protein
LKGKLSKLQFIDKKPQHQASDVEIDINEGSKGSGSEEES